MSRKHDIVVLLLILWDIVWRFSPNTWYWVSIQKERGYHNDDTYVAFNLWYRSITLVYTMFSSNFLSCDNNYGPRVHIEDQYGPYFQTKKFHTVPGESCSDYSQPMKERFKQHQLSLFQPHMVVLVRAGLQHGRDGETGRRGDVCTRRGGMGRL